MLHKNIELMQLRRFSYIKNQNTTNDPMFWPTCKSTCVL